MSLRQLRWNANASRMVEHTFCCRQSLQALFTPGWCLALPLVGLDWSPFSSPLCGVDSELRFRFRCEASPPGEVSVGEASCGDWTAAPGGSKETPLCQDIVSVAARRCVYGSGVGRGLCWNGNEVAFFHHFAPHHVCNCTTSAIVE